MDNNRLKKLANKMVDLFPTNKFRDPQETYDIFSNVYMSQRDYFSLFKPEDILKLIFYVYSLKNTKDFKLADKLINNLSFCNLLLITTEPYEAICGACNGDGDFDCDTCYGTGESYDGGDCPKCVQGRVTCQDCDGIGEVESDEVIYKQYQIVTWNTDIKNLCEMNEDSHTPAFSYDYYLKNHKEYIVLIIRDDNDRFIKDLSPDDMYSTYYDDSPELAMGGRQKITNIQQKIRFMEIHNLNPELKTFLKVLQKSGYPNTTPDVPTIAKAVSYPLDNFVIDLVNEIGEEKTKDFIRKTFKSLGLMSNTGMKIDLNFTGEKGSYIYLIIHNFDIVLDEPEEPVWIHYSYGDSLIIQDGEEKTLEDVEDEVDMGTMGEFSDYMDEIGYECVGEIIRKTGFVTHYDSRI